MVKQNIRLVLLLLVVIYLLPRNICATCSPCGGKYQFAYVIDASTSLPLGDVKVTADLGTIDYKDQSLVTFTDATLGTFSFIRCCGKGTEPLNNVSFEKNGYQTIKQDVIYNSTIALTPIP